MTTTQKVLLASLIINVALVGTLWYVLKDDGNGNDIELARKEEQIKAVQIERDEYKKKDSLSSAIIDTLRTAADTKPKVRYINNTIYEEAKLNITYIDNDSLGRFLAIRLVADSINR